MAWISIDQDNIAYDSHDIPKPANGQRSFAAGNKGHYIFQIRSGAHKNPSMTDYIVLEFHSSVTRAALRRGPGKWSGAATSLVLHKDDVPHVLAGLLSAMKKNESTRSS